MAFSQIYLVTLKTNRRVKSSSAFSICTLLINVFLNAVFIFGLFGLPKLGVTGVAIATLIARFAEMVFCLIDWKRSRLVSIRAAAHPGLGREYLKVTCPAMGQGFVWGGAMATLAAIMGHLGPEVVAANSIASAIQNAATVASFGLAEGGAILLGNLMGKGKLAEAKTDAAILLRISVGAGVICCILMLLMEGPVVSILNLNAAALQYFHVMYKMLSVNVIFAAVTYTTLNGIFLSGGDTRFGLYVDGAVMWGFCVLAGSIAAFVLKLPPLIVFVIVNLDELIKTPIVMIRYFQYKWLKNITK